MKEETIGVYNSVIRASNRPSRIALDQTNGRVAAEIKGTWLLTSGAPAEVDDKWIIMDF
jgi:hypothetical protein